MYIHNPWLGLSSYSEESLKEYNFYGRSKAIMALTALIQHNLFVTLYGRSGIGKTSILQAGVFPRLREDGFVPVPIRLSEGMDNSIHIAEFFWNKLVKIMENEGYRFVKYDKNDKFMPDFSDVLVLRRLFSCGHFVNRVNSEIQPVIVFDQFEEILYKYPDACKTFLPQLYALIEDNYDLGLEYPNWKDKTNFRIVVSVREDDLFLFEDMIDALHCLDFKTNRYRLLPLSEKEAKEIILDPASGIFDKDNQEEIAEKIIKIAKNGETVINTLMLSLTCYVLFNDCYLKKGVIRLADLNSYVDVLETYYLETIKFLPKKQRYYLEDNLVDPYGRRQYVYLADLLNRAPKAKELLSNDGNRLLNESQGRVELIHDQLASSVARIRTSRRQSQVRKISIFILISSLIILFFYSFSKFTYWQYEDVVTSLERRSVINDSEILEYDILENDNYSDTYFIDDCPKLKRIDIKKYDAQVYISNCPSLVDVKLPDNFKGMVRFINCPFLENNSYGVYSVIISKSDSIRYEHNKSEFGLMNFDQNMLSVGVSYFDFLKYDSLKHSLTIFYPHHRVRIGKENNDVYNFKIRTFLPDSLKRYVDCLVPYGTKSRFENLQEFRAFRSIKELPVYFTWMFNLKSSFRLLEKLPWALYAAILAVLFVQCLFWILAYNSNRTAMEGRGKIFIIGYSFLYGVGMSAVAILAYMAIYWFSYNILIPFNAWWPSILGVLSALIVMAFIYKDAFYKFYFYFRQNGFRTLGKDCRTTLVFMWCTLKDNIRRNKNIYYFVLSCVLILIFCLIGYSFGKAKRLAYLQELHNIPNRIYALEITERLLEKHGSGLYPFFSDSIYSFRSRLANDSTSLLVSITPRFINKIAQENGMALNVTGFPTSNIVLSQDGTKLGFAVINAKNDVKQLVILDLKRETLDTLSHKDLNVWDIITFSPSEKTVMSALAKKIYSYSIESGELNAFPFDFNKSIRGLVMKDDTTFWTISDNTLYEGNLSDDRLWSLSRDQDSWNNGLILVKGSKLISNGASERDISVLDFTDNSISLSTYEADLGEIECSVGDTIITEHGFIDLKKHIFGRKSDEKNKYFNVNNQFFLLDKTPQSPVMISFDGAIMINSLYSNINVFELKPKGREDWSLPERYKKIFDL